MHDRHPVAGNRAGEQDSAYERLGPTERGERGPSGPHREKHPCARPAAHPVGHENDGDDRERRPPGRHAAQRAATTFRLAAPMALWTPTRRPPCSGYAFARRRRAVPTWRSTFPGRRPSFCWSSLGCSRGAESLVASPGTPVFRPARSAEGGRHATVHHHRGRRPAVRGPLGRSADLKTGVPEFPVIQPGCIVSGTGGGSP